MSDYVAGQLYPMTLQDGLVVINQARLLIIGLPKPVVPDVTRGRRYLGNNNGSDAWEFWLTNGHKLNFSICLGRGREQDRFIVSVSKQPDLDRPNRNLKTPTGAEIFTRLCINPFCQNMVDIRLQKSGACKRSCMNYECTHPKCVQRAKDNGWPRATHPWGSKIAEEHKEYAATTANG